MLRREHLVSKSTIVSLSAIPYHFKKSYPDPFTTALESHSEKRTPISLTHIHTYVSSTKLNANAVVSTECVPIQHPPSNFQITHWKEKIVPQHFLRIFFALCICIFARVSLGDVHLSIGWWLEVKFYPNKHIRANLTHPPPSPPSPPPSIRNLSPHYIAHFLPSVFPFRLSSATCPPHYIFSHPPPPTSSSSTPNPTKFSQSIIINNLSNPSPSSPPFPPPPHHHKIPQSCTSSKTSPSSALLSSPPAPRLPPKPHWKHGKCYTTTLPS